MRYAPPPSQPLRPASNGSVESTSVATWRDTEREMTLSEFAALGEGFGGLARGGAGGANRFAF